MNVRSERIDPIADVLRARDIPFIYATGYGQAVAAAAPGVAVIEKPYTMEKLAQALTSVVEARS